MEGGVYPSVNNLYELPTYFNLIWCKKTCHILFDIALKSSIPSIQSPKSKIHHVFLLKAQYQSLQNSYFGDISPYRSDLSHTNIILTFFFCVILPSSGVTDMRLVLMTDTKYLVCLSLPGLSTYIQLVISGLLIVARKLIRIACLGTVRRDWISIVC